MPEILANVYRGDEIESVHFGDIVVCDSNGEILFSKGDPKLQTYFRSSAKPFQVLPLIRTGAYQKYDFSLPELSVMCASHSGESFHTETVQKILDKIENLKCGIHPPEHKPTLKKIREEGKPITEIHNNCSGKHSGALAFTVFNNWNVESYLEPSSNTQIEIKKILCEVTEETEIPTAVDGCSFPVFFLPLNKMALAFAKLAEHKTDDLRIVFNAMTKHPEFVAGTDRFDTQIMQMCPSKVVSKGGAEGIGCLGVSNGKESFGIALKISDGSSRAIPIVLAKLLHKFGVLTDSQLSEWLNGDSGILKNHAGIEVGKIEPNF